LQLDQRAMFKYQDITTKIQIKQRYSWESQSQINAGEKITTYVFCLFLNSGLRACKTGTLLLESCLQSILLWLFWRWWGWGVSRIISPDWPWTTILPILVSQVTREPLAPILLMLLNYTFYFIHYHFHGLSHIHERNKFPWNHFLT
jgi:hypothetical protein